MYVNCAQIQQIHFTAKKRRVLLIRQSMNVGCALTIMKLQIIFAISARQTLLFKIRLACYAKTLQTTQIYVPLIGFKCFSCYWLLN